MLKITLAGLVIQGIITLEEAEWIAGNLSNRQIPLTVQAVLESIEFAHRLYGNTEQGLKKKDNRNILQKTLIPHRKLFNRTSHNKRNILKEKTK